MKFDGEQIAAATGGRLVRTAPAGPILTDTRKLEPGAWFLAIVGEQFDGHAFIARAADAGASGAILREDPGDAWTGGLVLVLDTNVAFADLGRAAGERLQGPIVAITGSSGKTTTRALIALALSPLGDVHQTFGVPMTLLAAPVDAAASVVELGTSSPGEIAHLCDIVRPQHRVVVNVGPAHLEELGGLAGVAAEKGALFDRAVAGDVNYLNVDDPHLKAWPAPDGVEIVRWGRDSSADLRLMEARIDPKKFTTHGRYLTPAGEVHVRYPALGTHIALDGAAALAVAHTLGVDLVEAARAMGQYEPVGMRQRVEQLPGGVIAINDAYNANPASMAASLESLAVLGGRRVAVLGDMLELGESSHRLHIGVVALALSLKLDLVVAVGERMTAASPGVVWTSPSVEGVAERLAEWLKPGDRVLVKGSRGVHMEQILHDLRATHVEVP
ncbi:MAG: UDP-N-acetylmuramoyl-tripeptide--D-alanyl-D-alanine ligase [Kiritimatiellia bacterium]|jgi:UDP-N-acetylmuramoyl-tripeptide--D-alanyl-D-alanine ligase